MPEVYDQIDPSLRAIVPGLVVERVVEDYALVLLQVLDLVTDSHPGAFCADQGQVDSEFFVCGPVVSVNVRAGRESTEETVEVVSRDDLLKHFDRVWHPLQIFRERYIVQVEVVDVPVTAVVAHTANLVWRQILGLGVRWAAIWLEAFLVPELHQFFSDQTSCCFQLGDPRDLCPLPPSLLSQARHDLRAAQLLRVNHARHESAIEPHEQPSACSIDALTLLVRNFVPDELLDRKRLEVGEEVLFQHALNL